MHQVDEKYIDELYVDSIELLKQLIAVPSFSKEEDKTADVLVDFFQQKDIPTHRHLNNVWAVNKYFDDSKTTILLNSHHDTVKPNSGYIKDPFTAIEEDGKLYGLGSNDAGGCLVSLVAAFLFFYDHADLKYNLILAASAEEEISGRNGIEALLPYLGEISFGIVGEPTSLQMAIAEKGLMVIDCTAHGISGHAARDEGENAIYKALDDIAWFKSFQFPKISNALGPVKMSVTMVQAGTQHNVVPDTCTFTVDIRLNDEYTHEEALDIIKKHVKSDVIPRSTRLKSTSIGKEHPIVIAGRNLGLTSFGSATMSDKALMPFPALKIGPGDSARSHSADEYIYLNEIKSGIITYIQLLKGVL